MLGQQDYIFPCKNISIPSVFKEYKNIREEEEEDAGAAGFLFFNEPPTTPVFARVWRQLR